MRLRTLALNIERRRLNGFAADCRGQLGARVGVDRRLVARAADGNVVEILTRRQAARIEIDHHPVRRESLRAMDGRRIGVLEVDWAAAVQSEAPPSVVLELDAVLFDVDHPHAVAVRDVQGRIVARELPYLCQRPAGSKSEPRRGLRCIRWGAYGVVGFSGVKDARKSVLIADASASAAT